MHQAETVRGHKVPGWLAPALVMAISLLTVGWADATPQKALQYVDPAVASAKAQLAVREQALTVLHQMDATATVDPSVTYSDLTTNADPPAWAAKVNLNVNAGYSYNRPAILGNLYNLVRARDNVSSTLRRGIYKALYAQARMLQYQVIVTQTEAQVASASDDVAQVAAQLEAGKATRSDLEQRKLRLQNYQLRLDQYKQELQNLQNEAAGYGLDRHASYQPVRFVLLGARVEDTANYKLRDLNVKRAEAAFTQTTLYGTVQDLQLNGTYASGGVSVNTNLGVIDQHPRAEVNFDYPGGTDRWSVGVSASIVLSTTLEQIPDLQQRVDQAKTDLSNYESDFKAESAKRLANAKFAERGLSLDEEQLKLSQQTLDSAQQDVDKLKQALQDPKQQDKADLQKQMTQALKTLQRSQSDLLNAQRSAYSSWANYVRSTFSYLDYIDAPWTVKTQ